jgi:hypothetical protein
MDVHPGGALHFHQFLVQVKRLVRRASRWLRLSHASTTIEGNTFRLCCMFFIPPTEQRRVQQTEPARLCAWFEDTTRTHQWNRPMTTNNVSTLFTAPDTGTETRTIKELAAWRQAETGSRLLLPPIQRSVVWSNEQIINYWDSLLRGYPAGMMLVHHVQKRERDASSKGRDADGTTCEAQEDDFQLFDGQQRMVAVLLGLGKGQLKPSRKLWVDLGTVPNKSSGLKFQLRMTSMGQPFGYRPDAPNQKIELGKRQAKWEEWKEWRVKDTVVTPHLAFACATGSDLIEAQCAVAFAEVCGLLDQGCDATIQALSKLEGAVPKLVEHFVPALERALASKVILQHVDPAIVADQEEYIRFFGRVGQGGTRLSEDELTYSMIKHQYPQVHDRMRAIMQGPAGRLAGEVDLVLAALRVAKTIAPWDNAREWEVIGRPSPAFVAELTNRQEVLWEFGKMVGLDDHSPRLGDTLSEIKAALSYDKGDKDAHFTGLPAILLARLPRELVDVLVLFGVKRGADTTWPQDNRATLRAFVLHWLLFVSNESKAAWRAFQHAADTKKTWAFTAEAVRILIGEYEQEGVAYCIPRQETLSALRQDVKRGDHRLRAWAERFTAADRDGGTGAGEALRMLSTKRHLVQRALMWLQRSYLAKKFPDYDPTSDRDEDLPVDLDHIIPHDIFGFDWRHRASRLQEPEAKDIVDNFRWQRSVVGNSLGNFRWLAASDNRSRGKRVCKLLENNADLVWNPQEWNRLIPQGTDQQRWSLDDIATFQRLIDLRTLELYEKLLRESGIESILPAMLAQSSPPDTV